ncbi:MAG: T9SS type A sorting domain-containing protein, partial [Bacteroidia bacterium]|nr:T9SS type A sorting domain-containing protein [Bacteroidia bacterium]
DPVASLQIHPNPAGDEIHFRCDARVVDYLLTTVQGTETTTGEVWQEGDRCHCRVSSLKPGAYILSIRTEKGWSSGRFIKE